MPVQVIAKTWINILFILISVIMPISAASAQTDSLRAQDTTAIIHRGTKALQFQLGNPFSSREETPLIFACKYHLSAKSAIRISLEFNDQGSLNNNYTEHLDQYDTSATSYRDYFFQGENALVLQYFRYRIISPKINFYYGAGPRLSNENTYSSRNAGHDISNYDVWGLGIDFAIGAEWFPTKRISLTGEYGFVIRYLSVKSESDYDLGNGYYRKYGYKSYGVNLETLEAVFGISVYF